MSSTTKLVLVGVIAALLGAAAGVFIGRATVPAPAPSTGQTAQLEELRVELDRAQVELENRDRTLEQMAAKYDAAAAQLKKLTAAQQQGSTSGSTTKPTPPTGPQALSGKQFGYITKVTNETGTTIATVDLAQFLTGAAAAKAAKAAGDESPPPNDYYIVNTNTKLRTFPVKSGITVKVTTNPDGTTSVSGDTLSLAEWLDVYSGNLNPQQQPGVQVDPYWMTIKNGKIVSLEQQYLP